MNHMPTQFSDPLKSRSRLRRNGTDSAFHFGKIPLNSGFHGGPARRNRVLAALALMLAFSLPVLAATRITGESNESDKTLSPYFFVKSDDPAVDRLPLQSTSADVRIAGVIADVIVTQVYKNQGKHPLEAIYVFPASTRAAVYGMKMTIGERTIEAVIKEKEAARKDYEEAKQLGKSASLLEQQRPNVFQMNVANIMPGDVIRVELRYTELLIPETGVYSFIYPTVVGPRYSNRNAADASPSEKWVENPYLHQGELPPYDFHISVRMATGVPIQKLTCASHKIAVQYEGAAAAAVRLDETDTAGGNRDFILKYRLSGEKTASGLLLYQGKTENFFLLMVQPPARVTDAQIPPREYVFVVDVSGSMHGFPLDISKQLLRDLLTSLRPVDRFNVLLFAGCSALLAPESLPANADNINRSIAFIEKEQGGGGTELLPALRRALALPAAEGFSRTIVIATDGYVDVEKESFDLVRAQLGAANFFAFGIGSSVNRFLIEGLARAGMGEPFVVTRPEEAAAEALKFRQYIQYPVLTDIGVKYEGFQAYDIEPRTIPDVMAERPVVIFGKWKGLPQGRIVVHGRGGAKAVFDQAFDISQTPAEKSNLALRYLWARHRIAALGDYSRIQPTDELAREITSLGLSYNLLTDYTSFIAVDTVIRRKDGQLVTVKQPLPLPGGVSDLAVGGTGPAAVGGMAASSPAPLAMYPPAAKEKMVSTGSSGEQEARSLGKGEGSTEEFKANKPDSGAKRKDQDKSPSLLAQWKACLDKKAAGWRFPAAAGQTTARVTLRVVNGQARIEKLDCQGGLTSAQLQPVIARHLAEIAQCAPAVPPSGAKAGFILVLKLTLRPDGSPSGIELVSLS